MKNKFISPSLFAIIILCLALPFVTVSCEGQELKSLTGFNLAFGSEIEGQQTQGSFVGVLLLIFSLGGAGLYFWRHQLNNLVAGILGAAGVLFTFILKSGIDKKILNEGSGLTVDYKSGFYMTLLVFLAASAYNLYMYFKDKSVSEEQQASNVFCSSCGQKSTGADEFCSSCGNKL